MSNDSYHNHHQSFKRNDLVASVGLRTALLNRFQQFGCMLNSFPVKKLIAIFHDWDFEPTTRAILELAILHHRCQFNIFYSLDVNVPLWC